ncbi:hypothetical protein ACT4YP_20535 (plasmid) [Acinetobacter baumannii]
MKYLTMPLACQLLNEMPEDAEIYDSAYEKFFKTNDFSQLVAWSPYLNKWFMWLHPEGEHGADYWSCTQIMNTAALAEKYMNKYSSDFLNWHYQQSLKLHNLSDSEESRSLYENIYFDETNEGEREAEYRVWQYLTEKLDTSHKREAAKTEQNIFLKREVEELRGECNKLRDQLHRIKCADTFDAYNFAQAFYRRLAKTTDQQLPKELHELGIDAVYIQAMVNTAIGVFEFNRCDDLNDKDKRLEFPILLKTSKEIFESFENQIEDFGIDLGKDEEPKTLYDWSKIPEHVKAMATDEDGMACGWLVPPHIVGNAWRNQSHLSAFFNLPKRQNPYKGDWRESLELRPQELTELKAGDKVYVDFESLNRVEIDGKRIHGVGTLDRVEDGYAFGRLESGNPFGCPLAYVQPYDIWNNTRNEQV